MVVNKLYASRRDELELIIYLTENQLARSLVGLGIDILDNFWR